MSTPPTDPKDEPGNPAFRYREAEKSELANPYDKSLKQGPNSVKTMKWCAWEVLRDHPQGLTVKAIVDEIERRGLRSFQGKANPTGQVSGDMSRDSHYFFHFKNSNIWSITPFVPLHILAEGSHHERRRRPMKPTQQDTDGHSPRPTAPDASPVRPAPLNINPPATALSDPPASNARCITQLSHPKWLHQLVQKPCSVWIDGRDETGTILQFYPEDRTFDIDFLRGGKLRRVALTDFWYDPGQPQSCVRVRSFQELYPAPRPLPMQGHKRGREGPPYHMEPGPAKRLSPLPVHQGQQRYIGAQPRAAGMLQEPLGRHSAATELAAVLQQAQMQGWRGGEFKTVHSKVLYKQGWSDPQLEHERPSLNDDVSSLLAHLASGHLSAEPCQGPGHWDGHTDRSQDHELDSHLQALLNHLQQQAGGGSGAVQDMGPARRERQGWGGFQEGIVRDHRGPLHEEAFGPGQQALPRVLEQLYRAVPHTAQPHRVREQPWESGSGGSFGGVIPSRQQSDQLQAIINQLAPNGTLPSTSNAAVHFVDQLASNVMGESLQSQYRQGWADGRAAAHGMQRPGVSPAGKQGGQWPAPAPGGGWDDATQAAAADAIRILHGNLPPTAHCNTTLPDPLQQPGRPPSRQLGPIDLGAGASTGPGGMGREPQLRDQQLLRVKQERGREAIPAGSNLLAGSSQGRPPRSPLPFALGRGGRAAAAMAMADSDTANPFLAAMPPKLTIPDDSMQQPAAPPQGDHADPHQQQMWDLLTDALKGSNSSSGNKSKDWNDVLSALGILSSSKEKGSSGEGLEKGPNIVERATPGTLVEDVTTKDNFQQVPTEAVQGESSSIEKRRVVMREELSQQWHMLQTGKGGAGSSSDPLLTLGQLADGSTLEFPSMLPGTTLTSALLKDIEFPSLQSFNASKLLKQGELPSLRLQESDSPPVLAASAVEVKAEAALTPVPAPTPTEALKTGALVAHRAPAAQSSPAQAGNLLSPHHAHERRQDTLDREASPDAPDRGPKPSPPTSLMHRSSPRGHRDLGDGSPAAAPATASPATVVAMVQEQRDGAAGDKAETPSPAAAA